MAHLIFGLLIALSIVTLSVNAQVVNVTIFTESQCPFCTKLLREQIWPFHATRPGIMNLQIVPFGKGNCEYTLDRQLACTCMHGPTECDLNRLQNCAISYFPRRHLGLVTCIQGLANLDEAYQRCLSRLSPRTQQRLIECSKTQTGEVLNYYSMVNTHRAGIRIWPTVYVNGQFFDRSYPMETKICQHTTSC
ncbi:Gamma interferon inducible lysosomal thiol reductase [Aphelenchoides besseyi]|nr:Gamma interferon inducible lysosomal thiol reductase [Aphelenchoides besseyi]KAI6201440.1 Gamma interferon inducible lysosomal thiol reductase [Aphelenchoides besseyi]